MKRLRPCICILLVALTVLFTASCGGGTSSTGGGSTGTDGNPASQNGDPSGGSSLSGGVATQSLDEFVSYKIGVSGWLGRYTQGLSPTECWPSCDGVFDAILKVDPATKKIISACLEDWYYEDDVTLIMKLKENVYFSNGMHATAEDLLYSYTSIIDRGSSQLSTLGPIIWDECVVRDEYTVQFKFERPYRVFENIMVYLLCKEWSLSLADGWEDLAWYQPVGSGPYEPVDFVSEDVIVMRARDDYWNAEEVGPIYVDEWIIKYYKDPATMYMDLEVGNIVLCETAPSDYSRYVKNGGNGDGFDLYALSTGSTWYFTFSTYDFPAWEDKRLREAIAIGVNWDELGAFTFQELFVPADSILPKDGPYYAHAGRYEYNPERAKELLAEAGYGPDNPLKIMSTITDEPIYKAEGENLQFQLGQIGIDVELTVLDVASAIQVWNAGGGTDFMFWYRVTGSATRDAYEIMIGATRETGTTCVRVSDPKFRELWFAMVYNTDPALYEPALKEIQQYIYDEIIYIPFSEHNIGIGYSTTAFTKEQLEKFVYGRNMYQLGRLGLLSSWE